MKKIITLLIVAMAWAGAYAQDAGSSRLDISVTINDGGGNHSSSCTNKFEFFGTLSDGTALPVWTRFLNDIGGADKTVSYTYIIPGNLSLASFRFFGARNWMNFFDCSANGGFSNTQYPSYSGCTPGEGINYNIDYAMVPYWNSEVKIKVTPITYNTFYFGTDNSPQFNSSLWYLPANQRILIKATEGYTSNLYNWQYLIGNGQWTNFQGLSSSNTLLFSGNDISNDFFNNVVLANQPVYVRVVGDCGMVSNAMQLVPVLNTPNIANAVTTGQSCAGVNDGTIKITLNRAPYPGESLSILVDGNVVVTQAQFDPTNSYTLTNQAPGSRNISVRSTYNNSASYGNSNVWPVTVDAAPVITYALSYLGTGSSAQSNPSLWYLPQLTQVTINTTPGNYTSNQYTWQYQIGNGAWVTFPAAKLGSNTLTFSGNDISTNYVSIVESNQTVRVRLISSCGVTSNPMQLVPVASAPGVLTFVPTAPSCTAVSDGKIKITLNRALYTGETLSILVDGVTKASNLTQAQLTANSYTLTGIAGGTRTISFTGAYSGRPTFASPPTWTVVVPDTPFSFSITSSDIHCPGGMDGKINIAVQGGKAPYIVLLEESSGNIETSVILASGSITDLPEDSYVVRLVDSKACSPRDGAGNIIENMVTISQPVAGPVAVTLVTTVSPTSGQPNGSITVRATGGSGSYSFVWVDTNSGVVFTADPPVPIAGGGGMTDRLNNIGGGHYQIVVRDSQFALANPQTSENTAGCEGIFEYTLAATTRIAANLADEKADAHIQEFYVTPNPANGRFAASVSLREAGDFALTLFNSQGVIVSEQRYTASSAVTADFEVPSANQRGVYLLRLTTPEQSSAVRVLVE